MINRYSLIFSHVILSLSIVNFCISFCKWSKSSEPKLLSTTAKNHHTQTMSEKSEYKKKKINKTNSLLLLYSSIRPWIFFSCFLNNWNNSSEDESLRDEPRTDNLSMAIFTKIRRKNNSTLKSSIVYSRYTLFTTRCR